MSRIYYHITKEWLEDHYLKNKSSARECATLIGCGHTTIIKALKTHNIQTRPKGESLKIEISRKWLEEYYLEKELTAVECGSLLGCSKTTVLCRLKELSIPARRNDEKTSRTIEKQRRSLVGRKASPETIEKLRISHIGKIRSPEQIEKSAAKHRGMKRSRQTCENISKALAGNPKIRGENASGWRGGVSKQKYCPKFNVRTKRKTRERFNGICIICGVKENGRHHSIHHVDYNKLQGCKGMAWALVPLCITCHAKTNFDRWYWFNLLINYWAINPEINFNI